MKTHKPIHLNKEIIIFVIGDVHGKYNEYEKLISGKSSSIQIGDMGFNLDGFERTNTVNIRGNMRRKGCHQFFYGNHDSPAIKSSRWCLGDFGLIYSGGREAFFVSGADTVDKFGRIEGIDWWRDEQLSTKQMWDCLELYCSIKPKIVLSHDCPQDICNHFWGYDSSPTRDLLQQMLDYHQPHIWIFGHHHKSTNEVLDGTNFICLNELETIEI